MTRVRIEIRWRPLFLCRPSIHRESHRSVFTLESRTVAWGSSSPYLCPPDSSEANRLASFTVCSLQELRWMTAAVSGTSACPAPSLMTCYPALERGSPDRHHPPNLSFIFVLMINRASLQKLLTCPVIFFSLTSRHELMHIC